MPRRYSLQHPPNIMSCNFIDVFPSNTYFQCVIYYCKHGIMLQLNSSVTYLLKFLQRTIYSAQLDTGNVPEQK